LITYNSTKGIGRLAQININRRSFTPKDAVKNAEEHWNIRKKKGNKSDRKKKPMMKAWRGKNVSDDVVKAKEKEPI
jgi:hypothetical protein